ncbi:tRNA 5-hydroxyuridine methyltransferase [Emticicia aquatica]|uniref:tRNA 5-hydroxyuridine methyltransferase n=1 Tax=Emticicia aquatica TaxID=1681835 RepID=A0ABM9ANY2_9BACT|nr:class I SAM-dependent methyltransferase [Emticicia aquatica]CAH0995321.1 tRNA 5-hydroxyuridine methyltransferase [Emticicia aquatica]
MIYDYIKYLFKAKDEHSLHSPFLFECYTKILKDKNQYSAYNSIEKLRQELLINNNEIEISDFGAGSKLNITNKRLIKDIARNSLKKPKFAQLFYRIIKHYQYKNIIDLGTSFGLTTAYLAKSSIENKVFSFEGCSTTADIAKANFENLAIKNIDVIVGNIDETLPQKLDELDMIDFVFFDANHRFEPTIRYFELCLSKINENSCFIFDDIYWSEEMKRAWQYIKNHQSVVISIDLFWIGIVFFRKKQPKQNFVLKF